jgi:hypothetical protein
MLPIIDASQGRFNISPSKLIKAAAAALEMEGPTRQSKYP